MHFLLSQFETVEGLQETDIVCAQTRSVTRHPGNRRYGEIVDKFRAPYLATSLKDEKSSITRQVIQETQENGARFMRFNKETKTWCEMEKAALHEKVSHALRAKQRRAAKRKLAASPAPTTSPRPTKLQQQQQQPAQPVSPCPIVVEPAVKKQKQQHQQQQAMLPLDLLRLLSNASVPSMERQASFEPLDMLRAKSNDLLKNDMVTSWAARTSSRRPSKGALASQASEPLELLRCLSGMSVVNFMDELAASSGLVDEEASEQNKSGSSSSSSSKPLDVFSSFNAQQRDEFMKSWTDSATETVAV